MVHCGTGTLDPDSSAAQTDANKYAALSSYLGSPTHSSDPGSPPQLPIVPARACGGTGPTPGKAYPYLIMKGSTSGSSGEHDTFWGPKGEDGITNVVDTILENRKKLRLSAAMSSRYKVPKVPPHTPQTGMR
jgi:hypothetical protein